MERGVTEGVRDATWQPKRKRREGWKNREREREQTWKKPGEKKERGGREGHSFLLLPASEGPEGDENFLQRQRREGSCFLLTTCHLSKRGGEGGRKNPFL